MKAILSRLSSCDPGILIEFDSIDDLLREAEGDPIIIKERLKDGTYEVEVDDF